MRAYRSVGVGSGGGVGLGAAALVGEEAGRPVAPRGGSSLGRRRQGRAAADSALGGHLEGG
jgi:hypothetical protein